jgi:hypothetical protein
VDSLLHKSSKTPTATVIRADLAKHFKNTLKPGLANPFVTDESGDSSVPSTNKIVIALCNLAQHEKGQI